MKCQFKKTDGTSCKANRIAGSQYCFFHDPSRGGERSKAQSKGGRRNKAVSLPASTPDCDLGSIGGVVALLGLTINQVRKGQLDPKVGTSVGYLAATLLRSFELSADLKPREEGEQPSAKAPLSEVTLVDKMRIIYGLTDRLHPSAPTGGKTSP